MGQVRKNVMNVVALGPALAAKALVLNALSNNGREAHVYIVMVQESVQCAKERGLFDVVRVMVLE